MYIQERLQSKGGGMMFDESTVHTLTSLPATDLNFTSCLQRATDNQSRLALDAMRNREGKGKGRIKACERELRRRNKDDRKE